MQAEHHCHSCSGIGDTDSLYILTGAIKITNK
jgi:hypothetical protein